MFIEGKCEHYYAGGEHPYTSWNQSFVAVPRIGETVCGDSCGTVVKVTHCADDDGIPYIIVNLEVR